MNYKAIAKVRSRSLRRLLRLYLELQAELPETNRKKLVQTIMAKEKVSQAATYDYANALRLLAPEVGFQMYNPLADITEIVNVPFETQKMLPRVLPSVIRMVNSATSREANPRVKEELVRTNIIQLYNHLRNLI